MEKKIRIALIISAFLVFLLIFLGAAKFISFKSAASILISSGIALANFLLFSFSVIFSVNKSNKIFLKLVLGGMVGRLFLVLLLVFLTLFYLKVDQYAFIFGLLIWYVFLLIFEIGIVKDSLIKRKN